MDSKPPTPKYVLNPTRGGGGPTRPFTSNFDEYLKNRFPGTPETFWLFLTFIWASFEKKNFSKFWCVHPPGVIFQKDPKKVKILFSL